MNYLFHKDPKTIARDLINRNLIGATDETEKKGLYPEWRALYDKRIAKLIIRGGVSIMKSSYLHYNQTRMRDLNHHFNTVLLIVQTFNLHRIKVKAYLGNHLS